MILDSYNKKVCLVKTIITYLPAGRLDVQLVDQVPHEQHECILISRGMTEGKVKVTF